MSSIDNHSAPQIKGVYNYSASKDSMSYKDIDEGHGGIDSTVNVPQINDVVNTTSHDNSSFRKDLAGGF